MGQRIVVIGSSCTKTLAVIANLPYIELDALHWGSNWAPTPTPELRKLIQEVVSKECWVIDGNYSKLRDIIWSRVDTFVWLDYHLTFVLWRWLNRTIRRVISQERLWNGNRETFRDGY